MKGIYKLIFFSILLNFATGIMLVSVVDTNGNPVFNPSHMAGLPAYEEGYASGFTETMNGTITPGGTMSDKGDLIYRVLDMFNLGLISTFIRTVDNYMFGFINVLRGLVGTSLVGADFIFGIMKSIITIGYILGAFTLWTGKSLDD